MVRLPWRRNCEGADGDGDSDSTPDGADGHPGGLDVEPILTCRFQDGTLFVYDDHVFIERAGPSKFEDKAIPRDELVDVTYSKGIAIGYLQFEQVDVETEPAGLLSSPVDENTLHFGRGARECAERAREELLFGDP